MQKCAIEYLKEVVYYILYDLNYEINRHVFIFNKMFLGNSTLIFFFILFYISQIFYNEHIILFNYTKTSYLSL